MYITVTGPDIKDFDFQAVHVSVPSLETPSARQAATAVLFNWSRTAAATAFDKQLLIAQGAASGEDVAPRMVSKQVEEKKRTTKARRRLHRAPAGPLLLPLLFSLRRPACPPQQFRLHRAPARPPLVCRLNVGQFDLCNCHCFFLSVGQRVLRNRFVSDLDHRQTDKAKTR